MVEIYSLAELRRNIDMIELYRFVKPAGITTLSFLLATLVVGLNIRRNRKVLLPLHKALGITTVCLAPVHLLLVLLS